MRKVKREKRLLTWNWSLPLPIRTEMSSSNFWKKKLPMCQLVHGKAFASWNMRLILLKIWITHLCSEPLLLNFNIICITFLSTPIILAMYLLAYICTNCRVWLLNSGFCCYCWLHPLVAITTYDQVMWWDNLATSSLCAHGDHPNHSFCSTCWLCPNTLFLVYLIT